MRIDSRDGATGYRIYDAKRCCNVEHVIWVDTRTAKWGEIDHKETRLNRRLVVRTVQEERITVYPQSKLIIFNEIADDSPSDAVEIVRDTAREISEATLYRRYRYRKAGE